MFRPAVLLLGLLAVLYSFSGSVPTRAQSPTAPEFCSAPAVPAKATVPTRKVIIDRVEFDTPVHLSTDEIAKIVSDANQREWDAENPAWIDDFAVSLRAAWQNRGYFTAVPTAKAKSLGENPNSEQFLVSVHMEEGPQYHLGNIQFEGGTAFEDWELRDAFPMREGEIFDLESVRKGLTKLTALYDSHGYIDFTAVPSTTADVQLQRVAVVIHLNEERQYRLGTVEIRGPDQGLGTLLRSVLKPGEIYDFHALQDFSKQNQSILPPRFLERMETRRNARTGIVDLLFDLRPCPASSGAEARNQPSL